LTAGSPNAAKAYEERVQAAAAMRGRELVDL
jgi:hypothetical protein